MATIHRLISNDVWPHGFALTCKACGYQQAYGYSDGARYLQTGWPEHCGATMVLEDLMGIMAAADVLGITKQRLYQLVSKGQLKGWKHGSSNYYTMSAVLALKKRRAQKKCPHCRRGAPPQARRRGLYHCVDVEQDLWDRCTAEAAP